MKQQQAPKLSAALRVACRLSPVARQVKALFFEMQIPELSLSYAILTGRAIKLPTARAVAVE